MLITVDNNGQTRIRKIELICASTENILPYF